MNTDTTIEYLQVVIKPYTHNDTLSKYSFEFFRREIHLQWWRHKHKMTTQISVRLNLIHTSTVLLKIPNDQTFLNQPTKIRPIQ